MSLDDQRPEEVAEAEFIERIAHVTAEVIAEELNNVYENLNALAKVVTEIQMQQRRFENGVLREVQKYVQDSHVEKRDAPSDDIKYTDFPFTLTATKKGVEPVESTKRDA